MTTSPLLFSQPVLTKEFEEQGFVILRGAAEKEVELLSAYIQSRGTRYAGDFYYSLLSNSYSENLLIQKNINQLLSSFFNARFQDYRVLNESYLVKPSRTSGEMLLHQDWSYTDVSRYTTGTVWIPLCDVNEQNGTLLLLPGSHRYFKQYVSGSLPTLRVKSTAVPQERLLKPELKTGDVVVFNPAVFHGSCPNSSTQDRIVVTATVFPRTAPFFYAHRLPSGNVVRVDLEDDAFLKSLAPLSEGKIPEQHTYPVLLAAQAPVSESDLSAKIKNSLSSAS